MSAAGNILRIVPTLQAANLLNYNLKKLKKKKKTAKDFIDLGITNITSSALIKAEGDYLNAFD